MPRKRLFVLFAASIVLSLAACGGTSSGGITQSNDIVAKPDTTTQDQSPVDTNAGLDTNPGLDTNGTDLDSGDTGVEPDQSDGSAPDAAEDSADASDTTALDQLDDGSDDAQPADTEDDGNLGDAATDLGLDDMSDDTSDTQPQDSDPGDLDDGNDTAPQPDTADSDDGDDTAPQPDSADAADAGPLCKELSNVGTEILISEVYPDASIGGSGFIELYNPTNAEIDLGAAGYALHVPLIDCFRFAKKTTIPAQGYLRLQYPLTFTSATPASGEILLYKNIQTPNCNDLGYNDNTKLVDFVAWGTAGNSRYLMASEVGLWPNDKDARCGALSDSLSIKRKTNTTGTQPSDYTIDTAPTDASCVQ